MINIANDADAARASLLESPPTNNVNGIVVGGGNRRESTAKSILFFWADWHAP